MAMLEDTPYRVYYLIDKNRNHFREINPNVSSQNSSDSDDYKRISIRTRFNKENDFNSVKLIVVTRHDNDLYDHYNDDTTYEEFEWNDISESIVEIISKYYSDHNDEYQRIIKYADMINAMYENPKNILFTCDNEGRPRLGISGLPYIRNGEVLDMSITFSALNDSYFNICINDHNPDYKYQRSFTNDEFHEIVEKAKKYDQLKDIINGFVDDPAAGINLVESMMYNHHTPRW